MVTFRKEESREDNNGRRLNALDEDRLVKKVLDVEKGVGCVGWWGEFMNLVSKYEINEGDMDSVGALKRV